MEDERFVELLNHISFKRLERTKRYYDWKDAHRSLIAELLLRSVLIDRLDMNNDEITFDYDGQRKPFLKDYPNTHFSLSHSGFWIICGLDNDPIGIDVEEIKPLDVEDVPEFLSGDEMEFLRFVSDVSKLQILYRLWTIKESYVKALGDGLRIPLQSISIRIHRDNNIEVRRNGQFIDGWFFRSNLLDENHVLAVCSKRASDVVPISIIDIEDIVGSFLPASVHAQE